MWYHVMKVINILLSGVCYIKLFISHFVIFVKYAPISSYEDKEFEQISEETAQGPRMEKCVIPS